MSYSVRAAMTAPGSNFQGRVRVAALDYCAVVGAETGVVDHAIRQGYADVIFADRVGNATLGLGVLVSADGTGDQSDDETVIARVASLWNQAGSLMLSQTLTGTVTGYAGSGSGS